MPDKILPIIELLRLDKPIGFLLLFWPCAMSVFLLFNDIKDFKLIILFFIGSIIMRSVGCIINDLFDRDIDSKVHRTKNRPIAAKRISVFNALVILLVLSTLGFLILLQFNKNTIISGFLVVPFIILYPLLKRFTFFPQVLLGIIFNYGIIIGSLELSNNLSVSAIILYVGCVFWTIGYDTIYGYMDLKDDKVINVKSLSIYLEYKNYKFWLGVFYAVYSISLIVSCLYKYNYISIVSLFIWIIIVTHLVWQVLTLDINKPENCLKRFKSNNQIGILTLTYLFLVNVGI